MAEADRPGKLFIGNLNPDTNEKALESYFGKFGRISEVLLIRDRDTNKSKGYAFVTYENPSDAKDASRELNGKALDSKLLKVEQATKPRFESSARRGYSMHPRSRGSPRGSRGSSGMRGPPSRGMSPRGPPTKRGPPMRNGGPPPKRSALSGPMGRSSMYRDRDPYGPPRRDTMSRRDDYPSPRDDHYGMKDSYSSQDYMSSRDSRDYGAPPRDYSYRDYPSSSRDDYDSVSRGYGDRDGYGGGRDHRGYMDRPSGGSYRDLYDDEEDEDDDDYGNSRSAPHSRGHPPSYGRSGGGSRYDDYGSSSRDGYGSRDGYSSSRSVPYSASRNDRPPRQDLERGYPPRQYSSSSRGAPRGRGGQRTDRGMNRSRY